MSTGTAAGHLTSEARETLQGAYDLQVHVAPDVIARRIDDLDLAKEFLAKGLKGFVLKSHYFPTAERAQVVAKAAPGIHAYGAIALNHSIGGLNPVAIELAGRSGCKIVWMPTVDAANETAGRPGGANRKLPFWAQIQLDLAATGLNPPPMTVIDNAGNLTPVAMSCLELIRKHGMILATGHLCRREIFALVKAAKDIGLRKVIVTHAEFPSQNLSAQEQLELAGMGAVIEHCFTTMHTGKAPWEEVIDNIRVVGPERCLLSTDLGQTINPPVSEGFAMFAQTLLDAGFTAGQVRRMATVNSAALIEQGEQVMGKIVAAMATVHAPQLFTRPPTEDPAQLDADIAAMRELGKTLDETKPDVAIVIGSDHLETFFLSAVPTFAIVAGKTAQASFAGGDYELPTHPLAEELLDRLVDAGFDMTYSQDAVMGHSFAAVYKWVIEGRSIPVVPLFVNTYLPPLPKARRCEQLGKAIRDIVERGSERVAIIASGGMSHYPGTWKYPQPAYDFDLWAIAHMERSNTGALLDLTNEQLDEVGNTELLPWMVLFGAIGNQPAELLTYQPTWHHGHAVIRFVPNRLTAPTTPEPAPSWKFENAGGYQFYRHPDPAIYRLNKVIFDLRHSQDLRRRLFQDTEGLGAEYNLTPKETEALGTLKDESIDVLRSLKSHPLVEAGAHPLGMLMALVVVQAEQRRMAKEATK